MKLSKKLRPANRADRTVAWWSTLLLVALGAVLAALFLSGRMLLSLDVPVIERTSAAAAPLPHPRNSVAVPRRPNGSDLLRFDAGTDGGGIHGNYVSVATLQQ